MKKILLALLSFSLVFISCKKEQGPAGKNSLVNIVAIAPGTECVNGGIKIESGLDANSNQVLDASEVTNVQSVCNGTAGVNGHSSLMRTSSFLPNDICASGGLQVQTGIDVNDNGILEDSEVQQTQQICNNNYDKQVAILLTGLTGGYGTGQTTPFVIKAQTTKFNISNFPGVDSAAFMVSYLDVDQGTAINAKLYNMTDNVSFNNSLVSSNSSLPVIVYSRNIYNDLPKKDIDLGVELYSDVEGKGGAISYSYLILYRK